VIAEDPGPVLVVLPTLAVCEAFSKDRLAPLFRDCEALRGRVADPKSRDAGNTIFHRQFAGGHVTIVSSNSAAGHTPTVGREFSNLRIPDMARRCL